MANSIMAVEAGATQVQGTYIGVGERCGNANLSTIIGNLQLKKRLPMYSRESNAELNQHCKTGGGNFKSKYK